MCWGSPLSKFLGIPELGGSKCLPVEISPLDSVLVEEEKVIPGVNSLNLRCVIVQTGQAHEMWKVFPRLQ